MQNIRQLEHFIAVAQKGSYKAAAESLHYTQQAISISIRRLEEELGSELFRRSGSKLVLTAQGELLLKEARKVIALCKNMVDQQHDYQGDKKTLSLSIGVTSITTHLVWQYNLAQCQSKTKALPISFELVLCTGLGNGLLNVQAGYIDALVAGIIGDELKDRYDKDIESLPVLSVPFVVALSKNSPLAHQSKLSFKQLHDYEFVSLTHSSFSKLLFQEKCKERGFDLQYKEKTFPVDVYAWDDVEQDKAAMLVYSSEYLKEKHPNCVFIPLDSSSTIMMNMVLIYKKEADRNALTLVQETLQKYF